MSFEIDLPSFSKGEYVFLPFPPAQDKFFDYSNIGIVEECEYINGEYYYRVYFSNTAHPDVNNPYTNKWYREDELRLCPPVQTYSGKDVDLSALFINRMDSNESEPSTDDKEHDAKKRRQLKICPKCRESIPGDSIFCQYCGKRL